MIHRETKILLDIPIDCKTLDSATAEALETISNRRNSLIFACANPHSLVIAQRDTAFKKALINADLVVADGVGVTAMSRLLWGKSSPRITGHDYFLAVMSALQRLGQGRVFFLGSSDNVLELISKRFRTEFPSLTVCGLYSPPFGSWSEEENHRILKQITDAHPDVLWVGMTAPKQEHWVEVNRNHLKVPIIGSIGAVFDFYAGTYSRCPQYISRLGLEWAYRFLKEPRRMWKRNFVSAPKFVGMVLWRHIVGFSR